MGACLGKKENPEADPLLADPLLADPLLADPPQLAWIPLNPEVQAHINKNSVTVDINLRTLEVLCNTPLSALTKKQLEELQKAITELKKIGALRRQLTRAGQAVRKNIEIHTKKWVSEQNVARRARAL